MIDLDPLFQRPSMFISSTSAWNEERDELVAHVADFWQVYDYRTDRVAPAAGISPEERLRAVVAQTDIFVGILGADYGSTITLAPGTEMSIVEWEFDLAERHGQAPIVPCIKHPLDQEEVDVRQAEFLQRVRGFNSRWCQQFDSPGTLVTCVLGILARWSEMRRQQQMLMRRNAARSVGRIAICVALVMIVGIMAVIVAGVTARNALVASVALVAMVLMVIVLDGALSGTLKE